MNNDIHNLLIIKNARKEKAAQAAKLRKEARALRGEEFELSVAVIKDLASSFCNDMNDTDYFQEYVHNRYAGQFTQYVRRKNFFVSEEHREAQEEYMQAWRKMNRIFASYARDNTEAFVKGVTTGRTYWGSIRLK